MTIATQKIIQVKSDPTQAPAARTELPPVDLTPTASVDFDTRLMLTSVYMDVVLSGCDGVQEARQQAADAVGEAERYSDQLSSWQPRTEPTVGAVAQRVLIGAAQLIRERGWIQGAWDNTSGAMCLWGAVRVASRRYGGEDAELAALEVVRDRIGHGVSIAGWNDRRGRTVGEVLTVLG